MSPDTNRLQNESLELLRACSNSDLNDFLEDFRMILRSVKIKYNVTSRLSRFGFFFGGKDYVYKKNKCMLRRINFFLFDEFHYFMSAANHLKIFLIQIRLLNIFFSMLNSALYKNSYLFLSKSVLSPKGILWFIELSDEELTIFSLFLSG